MEDVIWFSSRAREHGSSGAIGAAKVIKDLRILG